MIARGRLSPRTEVTGSRRATTTAQEAERPRQEQQDDGQDGGKENGEKEYFRRHRSHQLICVVAMFASFAG